MSLCVLCGSAPAIKNSHIIAKLVGRRLMANAAVKTLRNSFNVNRPQQDIWKDELLCLACEKAFSVYESKFASDVYDPLLGGVGKVSYDDSLWMFAASSHFRYLHFALTAGSGKPPSGAAKLLSDLKQSCLRGTPFGAPFTLFAVHLWPIMPPTQYPPGINFYFSEVLDAFVCDWILPNSDEMTVCSIKLPSLLLVATDKEPRRFSEQPHLFDPHVIQATGSLQANSTEPPVMNMFGTSFNERSQDVQKSIQSISLIQAVKIADEIKNNPDAEATRAHSAYVRDRAILDALGSP